MKPAELRKPTKSQPARTRAHEHGVCSPLAAQEASSGYEDSLTLEFGEDAQRGCTPMTTETAPMPGEARTTDRRENTLQGLTILTDRMMPPGEVIALAPGTMMTKNPPAWMNPAEPGGPYPYTDPNLTSLTSACIPRDPGCRFHLNGPKPRPSNRNCSV